jgi:DNA-binding response OmpR family regulator
MVYLGRRSFKGGSMRILVVEDERDLNNVIVKKLTLEGYSVDACFNGLDALEYIEMGEYDAVILDIMLPKLSGLGVLERLRAKNNMTPILFLTAKDSIEDRVSGLDSGADDYLVKPFAFAELLARIRVLTRKKAGNATNVFSLADLTVNCDNHNVTRCGKSIPLTSKEFSILEYMIRNKGIVLQREQIERHIWNYDYEGGTNIIDVYCE